LLAAKTLRAEGYDSFGTDFESINPQAYSFWQKNFTAYTTDLYAVLTKALSETPPSFHDPQTSMPCQKPKIA
jgi:hypothetical protein